MTEQEKRRRRRERERRMRTRAGERRKEQKKGGLTAFRTYVTVILAGGCLLISQFQTETSQMVCGKVKEVISMQISAEKLQEWKEMAEDYMMESENILPVFREKKVEKKEYHPDIEESP